jgi:hypothetical protein
MSDKEAEQEGMRQDPHELEDEEKDESEEGGEKTTKNENAGHPQWKT